jgi:hypothetical protein
MKEEEGLQAYPEPGLAMGDIFDAIVRAGLKAIPVFGAAADRRTSQAIVLCASRYRPRTRLRHQVTQQAVSVRSTRAEEIRRPRVVMEPGRVTHAEQRAPDKPDRTSVGLFAIVPTFRNVGSRTPLRGSVSPMFNAVRKALPARLLFPSC